MGVALQTLNRETGQLDTFELTDRQAEELGLPQDPEVLGCGTMACAYASGDDNVAKITSDVLDARMSYIVMENPQPWAIPVHGVWRLPDERYAILAARAAPLTDDPGLATAIDQLYENVLKLKITDEQWETFRDTTEANIEDDVAAEGATPELEALGMALSLIDEAVKGFARLGMGWLDFHSGNWGIYDDRPVVIDLGLSRPLHAPPVRALERGLRRLGLRPL